MAAKAKIFPGNAIIVKQAYSRKHNITTMDSREIFELDSEAQIKRRQIIPN